MPSEGDSANGSEDGYTVVAANGSEEYGSVAGGDTPFAAAARFCCVVLLAAPGAPGFGFVPGLGLGLGGGLSGSALAVRC